MNDTTLESIPVEHTVSQPYLDGLKTVREIYPDAIPNSRYDKFEYYEYHKYKQGIHEIVATAAKKYDGTPLWSLFVNIHPSGDNDIAVAFPHAKKLVAMLKEHGYERLSSIAGQNVDVLVKEIPGFGYRRGRALDRILNGYNLVPLTSNP